jgi:hypothetical protein
MALHGQERLDGQEGLEQRKLGLAAHWDLPAPPAYPAVPSC